MVLSSGAIISEPTALGWQRGMTRSDGLLPDDHLQAICRLVARARSIPGLAERYRDAGTVSALSDLSLLPTMGKEDLALAAQETASATTQSPAYIFASGGTTSAPKISYIPEDMFVNDIRNYWRPLGQNDLFLNSYCAGKLWSSHYFHNELATASGSKVLPVGAVTDIELDGWIDFCATRGVTALGATPTTLLAFFARSRDRGISLPQIRAVLWVGEPWDDSISEYMAEVSPEAGRWGLYGSTETWVIGVNGPACGPDTFHALPYQYLLIDDAGLIDITCGHPAGLNLILRYQTGDAGAFTECGCDIRSPAIRVLGRRDGNPKFRGALLHASDIVKDVERWPGVSRAQVVLCDDGHGRDELEIHVITSPGAAADVPESVRRHLLATSLDIDSLFTADPESFRVRAVTSLRRSDRTAKTPPLFDQRSR
jgi:phenylacetate-coenzyme A ligase PaaK-like adenylate-forming protein